MHLKQNYFRLVFIKIIIVGFLFSTSCSRTDEKAHHALNEIIKQTKEQYCPDRRLAVFDIEAALLHGTVQLRGEVDNPAAKQTLVDLIHSTLPKYKILDNISILPDSSVGEKGWALINVSVANLRAKPEYSAELVNQIMLGTFAEILKKSNGWYYVRVMDGYLGWMNGSFFTRFTGEEKHVWENEKRIVYKALYGKVYENPEESSLILSDLVGGNILNVEQDGYNWTKVKIAPDIHGFVRTLNTVTLDQWQQRKSLMAPGIIKTALEFKGLPYLWGGNSPKGVDCSGFTQSVFKWNGIQLLRDASQQYRQGQMIDPGVYFENVQPGDLLFFGSRKDKITHVGLYLGDKNYIHSSGSVKINSFDSTATNFSRYRFNQFQGVRRILQ